VVDAAAQLVIPFQKSVQQGNNGELKLTKPVTYTAWANVPEDLKTKTQLGKDG